MRNQEIQLDNDCIFLVFKYVHIIKYLFIRSEAQNIRTYGEYIFYFAHSKHRENTNFLADVRRCNIALYNVGD